MNTMKHFILSRYPGAEGAGVSAIQKMINSAKTSLALRDEFKENQVLFYESAPTLAGVISDEAPGHNGTDRALLPGRCMTFDGTNQDWLSGSVGEIFASTNQGITAFIDVRFTGAIDANQVFFDCLEGTEGFRIYQFSTTTLRLQFYNSSGTLQTKTFATTSTWPALNDQKWKRFGFRFDPDSSKASCIIDGTIVTEHASQSFNTLDLNNVIVGSSNGNSDFCPCEVSEVAIYKASLSDDEVRDEYLNRYSTNPNYLWSFKNKSNVFDQVGTVHGTLDNVGVGGILTTSADVPVRKWDFNEYGYTNNSGTIVPRRIGTSLDAQGNALGFTGTPPRDAALTGAGCIDLDGTNQYGTLPATVRALIKEAASFSFRVQINTDTVSGKQGVFSSYQAFGVSLDAVVLKLDDAQLQIVVSDASNNYVKSSTNLSAGTWYDIVVSFNTSTNAISLWVDGVAQSGTTGDAPDSYSGSAECAIGRDQIGWGSGGGGGGMGGGGGGGSATPRYFNGQVRRFELVTSAVASVSAFDSATKHSIVPISEKSGTTSYNTVADLDVTWVNSPSWTTQDDYFWNQVYGATKSGSVYIPALLSQASDAAGNSIGLPSGNYLNNTGEGVNLAPIANTQWIKYAATTADFNGSTSKVWIDHDVLTVARPFKIEVTVNFDDISSSGECIFSSTTGVNDRIAISREATDDIRFRVYDGTTNAARTPEFESISATTEYKIVAEWNGSDTATLTVNGSSAGSSGVADIENVQGSYLGAHAAGGSYSGIDMFNGKMRDVKLTDNGTLVLDLPMANNSLDYTSNADYTADTSVSYLKHAGTKAYGTVVTPQSANVATSNQEKEFVMFTIGTE